MGDPARPSSGDAQVCAAVSLGWQVAKLYHSPVNRGPVGDPQPGDRLPGRSGFSAATQSKWLGEQIGATAADLLPHQPQALEDALAALFTNLDKEDRNRDATREAIFVLHCRLLEALSAANFRLGKAYGLGRALAETALVPCGAADVETEGKFRELLGTGRVNTIKNWLTELKSMLPDHTAYAVSRGLDDWCGWAAGPRTASEWQNAKTEMRIQGYIWRQLLTGEKAGKDMLSASGYLAVGWQIAKRTRWLFLAMALIAISVVLAAGFLPGLSPAARLAASLAWVAATLAAGMKAAGPLLGSAIEGAEGWLWQTELDESVAAAAIRVPAPEKHHRVTGSAVGEMSLRPEQAGAAAPLADRAEAAGGEPGIT
jgi:hypothetical protein